MFYYFFHGLKTWGRLFKRSLSETVFRAEPRLRRCPDKQRLNHV